ncbi:MAG: aspartate aminotransferase family protein [Oleiphilaceae bacterium]|nr:aspartate aminotransferase family protein [Oleiphilaceae bacterium]
MSQVTPVSRALFDEIMVPNYAPAAMIPVRGAGARVWDQEGKEYIDLAGGIAVSALGHCHPALVSALHDQAQRLWHVSNVLTNEPALRLAKLLVEHTFADRVFFANSGGEANEAAFKLARRYAWDHYGEEKNEIISFYNSFHGRTLFTVSVGGQEKYTEGFGPIPGGIRHAEYNNIKSLKALISDKTCAVVLEPIQGEGGIQPADHAFLREVRALCDQHNALLVFDEIQTGVGRTGALYAYMNSGVEPDILTTAKALGGGFPIAAMLATKTVAASLKVGTHGSTYGGNPLGCAVAEALLHEVLQPGLLDAVKAKGEQLRAGLRVLNDKHHVFAEVRGEGLLIGGEMASAYKGKAKLLMSAAADEGVMALIAGPDVLRLAPSLLIEENEIEEGLARLDKAIARFLTQD